MLKSFYASTQLRSGHILVSWEWLSPDEQRPPWQLVRRPSNPASSPDDGQVVFAMDRLFVTTADVWARTAQLTFAVTNTGSQYPMMQLETILFFDDTDTLHRMDIHYYDPAADAFNTESFTGALALSRSTGSNPDWTSIETVDLMVGGSPTGQLITERGHTDGVTADQVRWQPAGGPPLALPFDALTVEQTVATVAVVPDHILADAKTRYLDDGDFSDALSSDVTAYGLLRDITVDDRFDGDVGEWLRHTVVLDGNLLVGTEYTFRLFAAGVTEPTWIASAAASGEYHFSDHLYRLLPAVHRRHDEPTPEAVRARQGQLRRFLLVFGIALDYLRSNAENLRNRHNLDSAQAGMLPHLAHWIGWDIDRTLDIEAQRTNLRYAAETYRTVGTLPNIRSLVTRITGWPCETKEFVSNVFLTNAPETINLWELWGMTHDGTGWSEPTPLTVTDGLHGSPALARTPAGETWRFWHTDRRTIVLQRPGDVDPIAASSGASDDGISANDAEPAALFATGAVWLFWSSDRDNETGRDIWVRRYVGTPPGLPSENPVRLTDYPADDTAPIAVEASDGAVHLFWQSMRRGVHDIWTRRFDGADWGTIARLTSGATHETEPTAAVDGADRLWLFYVADQGLRRDILCRVLAAGIWSEPQTVITSGARDEAPAAVFWDGTLHLFWQSNRSGDWQLMTSRYDEPTDTWGAPQSLTQETTADKEPAVIVEGGVLRLVWRSQRRGRQYQSRTVDVDDPVMLGALGQLDDHTHYLFDTRQGNANWYARDVVGLYVTPDTGDIGEINRVLERARDFVEPFRPVHVRLVWILNAVTPSLVSEMINTGIFISDADWTESVSNG